MAFTIESNIQLPPITQVDITPMTDLGRQTWGRDPIYGYAQFIYAKATAAATVGQPVTIDQYNQTGVLTVTTARGKIGIAMATVAINSYGWFQIWGAAVVKSNTAVAQARVYATAVAGTVDDAVSATNAIDGAVYKTADGIPSAGFAVIDLNYPQMNGNG